MSAVGLSIGVLKLTPQVTQITSFSRLYPLAVPQGVSPTLPHCVVNIAAGGDDQLLTGAAGLYRSRIQIDSIAGTATIVSELAEAVRRALEERKPTYPPNLRDCFIDGVDGSDHSDDRSAFRRYLGFNIYWRRLTQDDINLAGGYWNDSGVWVDASQWNDGA